MDIKSVNHIAVICADYAASLRFYREILGVEVLSEDYRAERRSLMTKLALNGSYLIELFTFPNSPKRCSYPEACGLRHLAFTVDRLEETRDELQRKGVACEPIRRGANGESCFFCSDPDGLPLEFVSVVEL